MIPAPAAAFRKSRVFLALGLLLGVSPLSANADWTDELQLNLQRFGPDLAVETALVDGVSPTHILQWILQNPSEISVRTGLKALFCAGVPENVVSSSSNALGIPIEEYAVAREESRAECPFVELIHDFNGDGLPDEWQWQYFTFTTSLDARPDADPDGDGQNNRFEYDAGLVPTDPLSAFRLTMSRDPGNPGRIRLVFSPCREDRNYVILTSPTLQSGSWVPVEGNNVTRDGDRGLFTENLGTGARFYKIKVSAPALSLP